MIDDALGVEMAESAFHLIVGRSVEFVRTSCYDLYFVLRKCHRAASCVQARVPDHAVIANHEGTVQIWSNRLLSLESNTLCFARFVARNVLCLAYNPCKL
jgi:hypothetical protein